MTRPLAGGQLQALEPQKVPGLTGVVQLATGDFDVCVRLPEASVSCWGANDKGQLGDGTTEGKPVSTSARVRLSCLGRKTVRRRRIFWTT